MKNYVMRPRPGYGPFATCQGGVVCYDLARLIAAWLSQSGVSNAQRPQYESDIEVSKKLDSV